MVNKILHFKQKNSLPAKISISIGQKYCIYIALYAILYALQDYKHEIIL